VDSGKTRKSTTNNNNLTCAAHFMSNNSLLITDKEKLKKKDAAGGAVLDSTRSRGHNSDTWTVHAELTLYAQQPGPLAKRKFFPVSWSTGNLSIFHGVLYLSQH
jgi:hypothetical protein